MKVMPDFYHIQWKYTSEVITGGSSYRRTEAAVLSNKSYHCVIIACEVDQMSYVKNKYDIESGGNKSASKNAETKTSGETMRDAKSGDAKGFPVSVEAKDYVATQLINSSCRKKDSAVEVGVACDSLFIILIILGILILVIFLNMCRLERKSEQEIKGLPITSGETLSSSSNTPQQSPPQDNFNEEENVDDKSSPASPILKPVERIPSISVQKHIEPKITGILENEQKITGLLENAGQNKFSIAEEFAEWAKNKSDGESLLIIPEPRDDFWFIGDVHGCTSSIVRLISYIEMQAEPNRRQNVIFLGDLLDRGEDSWGVAAMVQKLMLLNSDPDFEKRWHFVFTKGNHDVGFSIKNGEFKSTVSPAESVNELNKWDISDADKMKLATAYVELVRISPCMGEIYDEKRENQTIVFCHGGVPHTDYQEELRSREFPDEHQHEIGSDNPPYHGKSLMQCVPSDMCEKISKDFIWLRLSTMPKKRPNRGNSGCEIGYEDVCDYCKLHQKLTGRRITHIIRGHDHETEGYKLNSYHEEHNPKAKYKEPCILTINAMEPDMSSSGIFRNRDLALAHWNWSMDSTLVLYTFPTRHL